MNAKEARQIAEETIRKELTEIISPLSDLILEATLRKVAERAKEGGFSVVFFAKNYNNPTYEEDCEEEEDQETIARKIFSAGLFREENSAYHIRKAIDFTGDRLRELGFESKGSIDMFKNEISRFRIYVNW